MDRQQRDTFVVKIISRQSGTWHGEVTWAETGKRVRFRNTMELIRLIDSTNESNDDFRTWDDIVKD